MKPKIKDTILQFLSNGQAKFGGTIDAYVAGICKSKHETIGRQLRNMASKGVLVAEYVKIQGVPNKVVMYKLKEHKVDMFAKKPETNSLFKKQ